VSDSYPNTQNLQFLQSNYITIDMNVSCFKYIQIHIQNKYSYRI
jgi:hypothetical protein